MNTIILQNCENFIHEVINFMYNPDIKSILLQANNLYGKISLCVRRCDGGKMSNLRQTSQKRHTVESFS